MKFRKTQSRAESGSVLATTLVITFVIGLTLASFLVLTQHQTFANARSQSWNNTMAVSEAGVEDALQMINKYAGDAEKLLTWAADAANGQDGWSRSNNIYIAQREIGDPVRARYKVFVDNAIPGRPVIRAQGWTAYDYEYAHASGDLATAGTAGTAYTTTELGRTVLVHTRRDALWALGMVADREIDFNGNHIGIDSFDSADPNHSYWAPGATYGIYDAGRRKDNGDVASNYDIIDSVSVGNADVMGHVSTGPGGTIEIGPNGSVGSLDWVLSGQTGIEPGFSSDDMNVRLDDITLPEAHWFALPSEGGKGTNINGVEYQHVISASGDYIADGLEGSVYVEAGVDARVYFTDSVSMTAKDEIRINASAVRLTIYMGGEQFKLAGNGVVNETGNAAAFLYYGLPSNTEIKFSGNASFTGAIYANHADFYLGGGGNDTYDFIGASVTRTVTMNGHYNFHYDENLANIGPSRGFIPTQWAEL